ncbi:MAG TPA: YtxH domain-containing protein [Syntrophales bacterium]|nr:YtxH domain-containing protein [Syntrophales bacterium]
MSDRQFDFMKGLLIGGLIGVAVGVLYAPKSGKETREDITRKTEELMDKAKEEYERAVQASKRAYEAAREKVEEAEEKAGELAGKGKEALQDQKGRLKRALDAGVEAYKEEKAKTT